MKDLFKFLLLIFLFLSALLSSEKTLAYTPKEGNVSAILAPFFYKTNYAGATPGISSPNYNGGYLMVVGDISDHGSLEVAMFYLPYKIYLRERYGSYLAERTQVMHVTMGYRAWFNSYFSGSLSFYSSYSMGDVDAIYSEFRGDEPTTSARDKTEYGFDGALQYDLWSKDRLAIVSDIRYSRSVTSKEHEMGDHYGYSVGIRYFIQEKKKAERPKNL